MDARTKTNAKHAAYPLDAPAEGAAMIFEGGRDVDLLETTGAITGPRKRRSSGLIRALLAAFAFATLVYLTLLGVT